MDAIDAPTYQIIFLDSLQEIFSTIFNKFKDVKYLVLTDDNLAKHYLKEVEGLFQKAGKQFHSWILNHGEINKTRYQKNRAENFLFKNKFERDDIIIALGGGLVGDFSGYVASSYLRGIRFIQVPTTVLSMVDASIGSKTGVNTEYGKNLVGAIYDPSMICVNVNFLKTLDTRNIHNGVAEMVKAALLFDKDYYNQLNNSKISEIVHKDPAAMKPLIRRSAELKLKVTNADKREFGLRKLLNFGHTIGHAIEFTLRGELLHGECVAIGMVLETELASTLGLCDPSLIDVVKEACRKHKLPVDLPSKINITSVMKYMENDKKNKTSDIHFVFLKDVSQPYEKTFPVARGLIKKIIASAYRVGPSKDTDLQSLKEVKFPGSKSITNRVLLMAALGKGTVDLRGVLDAEDTHIMLKALQDLHACEILERVDDRIVMKGNEGKMQSPKNAIYTENSGTSARFLTCFLLMLNGTAVLDGSARMKERPIGDLLDALKLQKTVKIAFLEKENSIPFEVTSQGFYGGEIRIKSKVSSQFVSSILMSAPYALNPVTLILEDIKEDDTIVSEPYVQMTIQLMEKFGIKVKRVSYNTFEVPQGVYVNPSVFDIEPDASTASYEMIYLTLNGGKGKILNLGSESVQGDSGFAEVIQRLGVNVNIGPNAIEVHGGNIKDLKPIDVNLANQTDTFMGLAVVLSQIEGVSSIRGIANQRVKECNRIRAVRKNLMKCGIYCKELEDGIEIHGKNLSYQKQAGKKTRVLIKTYNDHRIAMSFAVLGMYFANNNHNIELVIQNRLCVGKTFPGFWKHMETAHGVDFEGLSEDEVPPKDLNKDLPIFIIGMRYAGKSNFARILARKMNKKLFDMDHFLLEQVQKEDSSITSVKDLVDKSGWKAWRDRENAFLDDIAQNPAAYKDYVISTGGGIIEAIQNVELLHLFKNAIMIDRPFVDIDASHIEHEHTDGMRPQLDANSTLEAIYKRRLPKYIKSAKRIFSFTSFQKLKERGVMINEMEYWIRVEKLFARFQKNVFGDEPNLFIPDESFFLTVDLKVLENLSPQIAKYINHQYNAVELRIDYLLQEYRNTHDIQTIFKLLEERIAHVKFFIDIPIILTLRTKQEGGAFEITKKEDWTNFYQPLYLLFSKTNLIEIYDVEYCAQNLHFLQDFRGRTQRRQIILSKHYIHNISDNLVLQDIEVMNECEETDIIKIVLNEKHSMEILDQVLFEKPLIKIRLGNGGKHTRVECKFLCPVFDPLFGASLAPGQMSKEEIMNVRINTGLTSRFKTFYLFGSHVTKGLSPIIHNTYFQYHALHDCFYDRKEVHSIEEVMKVINEDPYFKGGSITMPFKKDIIPFLDYIHPVAKELGVVNTIVRFCGKLYGWNTDWIGMLKPLRPIVDRRVDLKGRKYGLIIGAGATSETASFVLQRLGLEVAVYNRSRDRVLALKEQKPDIKICTSLETLEIEDDGKTTVVDPKDISIIISTVPGWNELVFPESIFRGNPIIFDVAYVPKETRFIEEAKKNKCESIIYGIEMLLHQGFVQDEYFIGKKAPKRFMTEVVNKHYEKAMGGSK